MDILLDTHALIWFINGDNQLPVQSIEIIKNISVRCFVSIASIWEIAIKISLGKLDLNGGFDEISKIMMHYDIDILPISFEHIQKLLSLDFYHRDPFDRIIIAQGLVEKMTIVSKDENFAKYQVQLIWD
jgi:PIN domain nuclease of toxin-antitoxin system